MKKPYKMGDFYRELKQDLRGMGIRITKSKVKPGETKEYLVVFFGKKSLKK